MKAFDKSKPLPVNPVESDTSSSDSEDESASAENLNVQNRGSASNRLNSQRIQAKQQKKHVIGQEKLKELEEKWWL